MALENDMATWLGDTTLTGDQAAQFDAAVTRINEKFPDTADEQDEINAALSVALQVILGEADGWDELARKHSQLQQKTLIAKIELYERIWWAIQDNVPELTLARETNLDRMTIRKIAGKR